jgi:hypothetical protein
LEGFNIQFIQVGNGSGLTNKPTSAEFGAFIDATTETNLYKIDTFGTTYHTDVFTASASGSSVKIQKIDPGGATGDYCDVIGRSHPLSQVNGRCEFSFNASAGQGYTIGLIRSQGASPQGVDTNYACIGGMSDILNPVYDDDVKVPIGYGLDDGPPLLWDVAFNWVSGEDGQVIHLVTEDTLRLMILNIRWIQLRWRLFLRMLLLKLDIGIKLSLKSQVKILKYLWEYLREGPLHLLRD